MVTHGCGAIRSTRRRGLAPDDEKCGCASRGHVNQSMEVTHEIVTIVLIVGRFIV